MRQVSQELNVKFDFDANSQRKLELFIQKFVPSAGDSVRTAPLPIQAKLFLLSNDIFLLAMSVEDTGISLDHPQFVINRDKELLRTLQIDLERPFQVPSGDEAQKLWLEIAAIVSVKHRSHAIFYEAGWNLPQALIKQDSQEMKRYLHLIGYPEALTEAETPDQIMIHVREYFEGVSNPQE